MAVIYITEADETQHKFRLPASPGTVVTIGRREDCLVSLPQVVGLSGLHCSIALVGSEYIITDEGSSNGTLIGSRAIASEPLRAGIVYSLGTAVLTYDPEPADSHAPAPAPAWDAQAADAPVMEPIPVSEYEIPAAAPAPAPAYDEASAYAPVPPPAAPAKKKKRKVAVAAMGKVKDKQDLQSFFNVVYALVVLAIAFYAGVTLRHWLETGSFLPTSKPVPAQAAAPAAKAAASAADADGSGEDW